LWGIRVIAVVDYDAGNLRSITHGLRLAGAQVEVTSDPAVVRAATAVVVPGVGAASDTMASLRSHGLEQVIADTVRGGKPYLGVCMGLQVLATISEEGGRHTCLDVIPGTVRRLTGGAGLKVPHMGWNQVTPLREGLSIFADLPPDAYFYFAHSYYVEPQERQGVAAVTAYGSPFCSVIVAEHVWGTQFHPEKSGVAGLQLLKNFVKWVAQ